MAETNSQRDARSRTCDRIHRIMEQENHRNNRYTEETRVAHNNVEALKSEIARLEGRRQDIQTLMSALEATAPGRVAKVVAKLSQLAGDLLGIRSEVQRLKEQLARERATLQNTQRQMESARDNLRRMSPRHSAHSCRDFGY